MTNFILMRVIVGFMIMFFLIFAVEVFAMAASKSRNNNDRNVERCYWIAVMKTDDFDDNFLITFLLERKLTRYILISKQCYSTYYEQNVRYASFTFFKLVPKSYFGKWFPVKHDMIPILNVYEWLGSRQAIYHGLIEELGTEFEFKADDQRKHEFDMRRKRKKEMCF